MSRSITCLALLAALPLFAQDHGDWDVKVALGGADMTKGWRNPEVQPAIQLGLQRQNGNRLFVVDVFYTNPDDSDTVPFAVNATTEIPSPYEYEVEQISLEVGYGLQYTKLHYLGRLGLADYSEQIETIRGSEHFHAKSDSFGLQLGAEVGYRVYKNIDLSIRASRLFAANSETSDDDPLIKYTHNSFSTIALMVGYTF